MMHLKQVLRGRAMRKWKISASMIVAVAALFVALGGVATAAGHYIITSNRQIAPGVLKQLKKPGPRGQRGTKGATGASGADGTDGTPGATGVAQVSYVTGSLSVAADSVSSVQTTLCPSGSYAVGSSSSVGGIDTTVSTSIGATQFSWFASNQSEFTADVAFYAVCASGPGLSIAATAARAHSVSPGVLAAQRATAIADTSA
jgi:hypothetical protein